MNSNRKNTTLVMMALFAALGAELFLAPFWNRLMIGDKSFGLYGIISVLVITSQIPAVLIYFTLGIALNRLLDGSRTRTWVLAFCVMSMILQYFGLHVTTNSETSIVHALACILPLLLSPWAALFGCAVDRAVK